MHNRARVKTTSGRTRMPGRSMRWSFLKRRPRAWSADRTSSSGRVSTRRLACMLRRAAWVEAHEPAGRAVCRCGTAGLVPIRLPKSSTPWPRAVVTRQLSTRRRADTRVEGAVGLAISRLRVAMPRCSEPGSKWPTSLEDMRRCDRIGRAGDLARGAKRRLAGRARLGDVAPDRPRPQPKVPSAGGRRPGFVRQS